jgi:hypothetical protein
MHQASASRVNNVVSSVPKRLLSSCRDRWVPDFLLPRSVGVCLPQVDHVPRAQALADFAQLRSRGREESAQQPFPLDLFQPSFPALSTTTQPLKDRG